MTEKTPSPELLQDSIRLKELAQNAALSVGDFLRASFRSGHEIAHKRDYRDVVTESDKESERRLSAYIFEHEPNSSILGEEGGANGDGDIHWFIDPIDGTGNFATGVAFWCVSIAAAIDGEVVAGAVYDPIANNMFSADLNGAYLNGTVIHAKGPQKEKHAVLTTNYPAPRQVNKHGDKVVLLWGEWVRSFFAVKRIGSAALSLCYVANGWFAATFSTAVNAWDVAAASFILKQAGGTYKALMPRFEGEKDYLSPAYYGTVAGAEYPSLDEVGAKIVAIERSVQ
ncbi:MAG: inositol monophosphatase family protein [Microbacteriaceae bacterium]